MELRPITLDQSPALALSVAASSLYNYLLSRGHGDHHGTECLQNLIESHLLSGTMMAGKREDAPGWRLALTIGVPGFPPPRERWQDIAAEDLFRIREPTHGASASAKGAKSLIGGYLPTLN
jgi:hypothetical protein